MACLWSSRYVATLTLTELRLVRQNSCVNVGRFRLTSPAALLTDTFPLSNKSCAQERDRILAENKQKALPVSRQNRGASYIVVTRDSPACEYPSSLGGNERVCTITDGGRAYGTPRRQAKGQREVVTGHSWCVTKEIADRRVISRAAHGNGAGARVAHRLNWLGFRTQPIGSGGKGPWLLGDVCGAIHKLVPEYGVRQGPVVGCVHCRIPTISPQEEEQRGGKEEHP